MAGLSASGKVFALSSRPDIPLSFLACLLGGSGPHRLLKTRKPWESGGFACKGAERFRTGRRSFPQQRWSQNRSVRCLPNRHWMKPYSEPTPVGAGADARGCGWGFASVVSNGGVRYMA